MKKINIMGIEYKVFLEENPDCMPDGCDGYCDAYDKEIHVLKAEYMQPESAIGKNIRHTDVVRHEIIHAIAHECGMTQYSTDEFLTEWLTQIIPRIESCVLIAITGAEEVE